MRAKEDSLLLKISDKFFYQFLLQDVHVLQNILRVLVNRILKEEQKNVELLQAILPKEIADELKLKGSSSPVHFECVSVVFTDFKGFTKIAEKMDPMELIKELDGCFSQFDLITGKYKLEKLKTIGDSYMFAGGIPIITPSKTPGAKSAIDSILASMEIIKFMERVKDVKMSLKEEFWELRLGIHSGPLVAGVIGEKKFAYDVWGDTVNTASRIESTGEVGKLNISGSTYNLIKDFFDCEYRGKIPAKNKGEIDMYFVTNIKPHLVRDNEIPNKEFWDMYDEL
ncbi:MAG: adenylate/guanylate cyclase domain-containing protein [Leptospiraceae bacterium]|nr:adenylate/guanylate cyclase domain-containing protein [Leptospiraceae bacterium]